MQKETLYLESRCRRVQKLRLSSRFTEGVGHCLSNNELEPEIVELLREIEQQKLAQFPLHQWNLIYASEVMQSQMRGSQWLRVDIGEQVRQTGGALGAYQSSVKHTLSFPVKTTAVQERLEKSSTLGDLYHSLSRASPSLIPSPSS
ncbi:DUF3080 family protein [Vibrio lentus]|nr:DUF3080 family protein [Vibrio lentus]